jgi:small conductance mechanosensitive channel
MNQSFHDFLIDMSDRALAFIPDIFKAIGIFIIGIILIKTFRRFMNRLMLQQKHDPTVLKFLMDLCTWIFRVVLIIAVIGQLGVPTTSFVAVLGAAGLAIGLSLQGSLSNFAGGILIVLFKPMRVGDYIEAQGQGGTVSSIQIFSTKLITPTNQVIYIPNGILSNGVIKNYSQEYNRKTDLTISVAYNSDLKKVKDTLTGIAKSNRLILNEPAPSITIKELGESSVSFQVSLWATVENYPEMLSDFLEAVKTGFDKEGISTTKKESGK